MEGGKKKKHCRECLGYVNVDFDAKDPDEQLPPDELDRVMTILRTSYHTWIGYESISGLGYHAIVPYILPEDVKIDLVNDFVRSEKIYKNVCRFINNYFSAQCGHKMDEECDNINRLVGLSHDPNPVYRPDARPFRLTHKDLGINDDGTVTLLKTPKKAIGKSGHRVAVPLGDSLERAVKRLEDNGIYFDAGHHDFIMHLSFDLCHMGVNEDEAAQALDDVYGGLMNHSPSRVLHSCYKSAEDEFGAWLNHKPKSALQTEIITDFLSKKADSLKYDVLTQKTFQLADDNQWYELNERISNNLYLECCSASEMNITKQAFETVLNSSVVREVNPLREYVMTRTPWTPGMPDYIAQAASQVLMATERENELWPPCFRKWFVNMVAGWIQEDVVNHQVIVLVGSQGIFKSTWIRRLMPPELKSYVSDMSEIERLDKDEQLRAVEFGLINLDELDKLSDRELNKLKAAITATDVNVRAAFGHHKERRIRIASYVGSGNKDEFLTDQTGNRRWLPFHVVHIDSPFEHTLPYDGMYAQASYLLNEGFNYWFDQEDIDALKDHVEQFMAPASEEQLIQVYFSKAKKDDPDAEFLTLPEISAMLTMYGVLRKSIDNRRLGAIMKKIGYQPARSSHDGRRGYIVRKNTDAEIKSLRDPKNACADIADNADIIF